MTTSASRFSTVLALGCVTAFTAGVVNFESVWDRRVEVLAAESSRIASFRAIPNSFGLWQFEQEGVLENTALKMMRPAAQLAQVYRHQVTGKRVTVVVLLGPPETLCRHDPQACYAARSNVTKLLDATTEEIKLADGGKHGFRCARISTSHEDSQAVLGPRKQLTILYAWNTGGNWQAPAFAQFRFAAQPWIYKLEVITESSEDVEEPNVDHELCRQFLAEFLPELSVLLRSSPTPSI